jgi:uncharacterized protein involved in exopolysaccharide biosynthesis
LSEEIAKIEETGPQGSLRDLYYVLFRHKWKIIVFFLAAMIVTAVRIALTSDTYLSEAKLLVRLGHENVTLDPTATTGTIVPVRPSHESAINTELEILKSQEIAEMAVDSIGAEVLAYKEHPVDNSTGKIIAKVKRPMHVLVKRIRQLRARSGAANESNKRDSTLRMVMDNLRIEKQKMGSTITLSYKSQNPQLAQEVLTKLIDSYLEKHIAVHQTPGSHEFFTQQSAHLHGKLTELEDELRNLRKETGISSFEQQQHLNSNSG